MRIVAGVKKGQRLKALEGGSVRPTTDRVKESLFNILQYRVEGRVFLDLFAGSGQVGIEALSRGAKQAVFVDNSRKSMQVVKENITKVGFAPFSELYQGDFQMYLAHTALRFDVVYIDPPYRQNLLLPALEASVKCTADTGIVVCEHPLDEAVPDRVSAFLHIKSYRYGKILLSVFEHEGRAC